jgi:hypothetical protein
MPDVLGLLLILGGAVAFVFGSAALARAEDLQGLYWLAVGVCATHAAVQMVRPRAG